MGNVSTTVKRRGNFIGQLTNNRTILLLLIIVLISVFMSFLYPKQFMTFTNFSVILLSVTSIGILSVGMVILIISGEIDLSVGANLALGAAVSAHIMNNYQNIAVPLAVIAGIAVSAFAGFISGIIVARIGVNSIIATFAMMGIIRAIATRIASTGFVSLPESFQKFGQTVFLKFRSPVYYMILLVIIFSFLARNTGYFRKIYFIGGNEKAAKLSGINVIREKIISFVLMGALAGFAGVVLASRLNFVLGDLASGIELQVIAGVIIGGGSLAGGIGTVAGAFMGCLFIAVVQNALVIGGVNIYVQGIIVGVILIIAASIDILLRRKL